MESTARPEKSPHPSPSLAAVRSVLAEHRRIAREPIPTPCVAGLLLDAAIREVA